MRSMDCAFVLAAVGACATLSVGCTQSTREPSAAAWGSAPAFSVFTDTGANMNLNDEGRQEFASLRGSAAPWVRALAPLWVAHHRGRRLVHGLYERSPLEYRIYTSATPTRRACFQVEKSTPIWRDRLAWTR